MTAPPAVIRRAETEADLERCVEIFNAAHAEDRIALQDFRSSKGFFLLHPGGGYAYLSSSSIPGRQYTMVRVQPDARRHGIGTALLGAAVAAAGSDGNVGLVGRVVDPDDAGSRAWAKACGFRETRRDVELLRPLRPGDGEIAEGIVPMRAEHLRGAYAVEVECVPDVPATTPMLALPFVRWHELIAQHAVTFVALDGGGCVVGYATLEHLHGMPHRLEHGLTAVLRSQRGRGVATRLKRAQIAWAASHGYTELVTFTDTANLPMRRVNTKLGYAERLGPIVVEREL
ncbi:MAG: N-acetyltransferase family protein [Verrucomicrobiota bacterium]